MNPFTGGAPRQRSRPNLYQLLPGIYRRRDEEIYAVERLRLLGEGENLPEAAAKMHVPPLKAMFDLLQGAFDSVEREIAELYDDWFVETCRPEMLPLLAEPLGIRELETLSKGRADMRAVIANIINYRRRKGTIGALEEFAADATGWTVVVGERLQSVAALARVDGEATRRAGYADVRRRAPGTAKARPATQFADVADSAGGERAARIDVWRVQAAHVTGVTPGIVDPAAPRKRTFSPVGDDCALMRPGAGALSEDRGARELTRADARADLARHRPIVGIDVRELRGFVQRTPRLEIADLSAELWNRPETTADPSTVYVDPELGRLLTPEESGTYTVDYWIAANAGIGAAPPSAPWPGSFDRTLLVAPRAKPEATRRRRLEAYLLSRLVLLDRPLFEAYRPTIDGVEFEHFATEWTFMREFYADNGRLPSARELSRRWPLFPISTGSRPIEALIDALTAPPPGETGPDGSGYTRFRTLEPALQAAAQASGSVRIVLGTSETHGSADGWTFQPGRALTALSIESAPGARPTLLGSLFLLPYFAAIPIHLRGLNVRGRIVCGQNAELTIERSTLRPVADEWGRRQSLVDAAHSGSATRARRIAVHNSVLGGARLSDATDLSVEDSVVTDPIGPLDRDQDARGPFLSAQRSTFLGSVDAYQLIASDTLFDQPARAKLRQRGYLRYCLLRSEKELPPRYKCPVTDRRLLASKRYGRSGFARLRADAPDSVLRGGSDGAEIGAFGLYGAAQRAANLEIVLDEFLPEGVSRRVYYRS